MDRGWRVRPLRAEALAAFDRIVGLDLSEVAIDGSLHKAPYGGEGTGPNPCDRGKQGWKWSIGVERHGIPLGWAIDGANRNDVRMLAPTLDALAVDGWLAEIETMHLDRGYDYPKIRHQLTDAGLDDHVIQRRRQPGDHRPKQLTLGLRWIVEAANSWLSNYGQLRRWFRHTHATSLLLAGAPALYVARRLGHADVTTTLNLYGWVSEDAELRAVDWRRLAGWRGDHVADWRPAPLLKNGTDRATPFTANLHTPLRSDLPESYQALEVIEVGHPLRQVINNDGRIGAATLHGLPAPMRLEVVWWAPPEHDQRIDGERVRAAPMASHHRHDLPRSGPTGTDPGVATGTALRHVDGSARHPAPR